MDYKKAIIRKLIEKWQNSKYSKENKPSNTRIKLSIKDPIFDKYWANDSYLYREKIEHDVQELEKLNFVVAKRKEEMLVIIFLVHENIDKLYDYLDLINPNDVSKIMLKYSNEQLSQKNTEITKKFLILIKERLLAGKSIKTYAKNLEQLQLIVFGIESIVNQSEEILIRNFSKKIFSNSKTFEKKQNLFLKIFNRFSDIDYDTFESFCLAHNIVKNMSFAYLKNGLTFKINNQVIDLDNLGTEISISDKAIDVLEILSVTKNRVITVENLTTFNYLDEDAVIIYLGGFHNSVKRNLIMKINDFNSNLEWFHYGDIDAGGVNIFLDLVYKTQIPFQPYKMDIDNLIKYKSECQKLTKSDVHRLNNLLDNPKAFIFRNVIRFMLDNDIKLEQESII